MKKCEGCGLEKSCASGGDKLTWRNAVTALLSAILMFGAIFYFGENLNRVKAANKSCYSESEVADADKNLKKCLTIFDDKVYDFTIAKKWDLTGHVGQHLCGRSYDKETIEQGPHKVSVMDRFYVAPVCGKTVAVVTTTKKEGDGFGEVFRQPIRRVMVYVALFFFVLNFATCYAMPWAKLKEPWAGEVPGPDKSDQLGHFPLTHWHKIWAWCAVCALTLHALLSFSCMLFGKCF